MGQNWPFQVQSFLILFLIYLGVYFRRKRSLHVKIMSASIVWDLLLIVQIEFSRSAIAKAARTLSNPLMLNIHVGLALSTVLLYFGMIYTGRGILQSKTSLRPLHRKLGYFTVFMRTMTLITSFFTHS